MSVAAAFAITPDEPVITARQFKKLRKNPALTAEAAGLHYVQSADAPGFVRKGKAPRFYYTDAKGQRCKDPEALKRIKSLVLPPAWTQV